MSDINEIIGRALLAVDEQDGSGPVPCGDDLGDRINFEAGCVQYANIGAAVQKALAEAGYEVVRVIREEPRAAVTISSIHIPAARPPLMKVEVEVA